MKKCDNDTESCSKKAPKRAAILVKTKNPKPNKFPKSLNSNQPKVIEKPNAPHNTTGYIIDQHPIIFYDPEELLGQFFDIGTKGNFLF